MKYCTYCGKQLEKGEPCTCGYAKSAAAKRLKKLKKWGIPVVVMLVVLVVVVAVVHSVKPIIDLNDYLVIEGVFGPDSRGVAVYGLDEDGLRDAILGLDSEETMELSEVESLENDLEVERTLACITLAATPEGNLSNGDIVTITAKFKNENNYKLHYRYKDAETHIAVWGLGDTDTMPSKLSEAANQQGPTTEAEVGAIDLTSAEEFYALGRILSPNRIKSSFLDAQTPYAIEDDLNKFAFPKTVASTADKIKFLKTASYSLKNDVALTIQTKAGSEYFYGLGSPDHPFGGSFYGNGHTITLSTNGNLVLDANAAYEIGLFSYADGARIADINVVVKNDILARTSTRGKVLKIGAMIGYANKTEVENCSVSFDKSNIGVDFSEYEKSSITRLGGFAGASELSTFKNCTVKMADASITAKGTDVGFGNMYATLSVGGFLGFSHPGSDNTINIGRVGNQMYNCKVISENTEQRDVVSALVETGDELAVGGLVGCSFNNFIAKNCSVEVTKGNISAVKTAESDTGMYGTQVGGIIGRLEHTGELANCVVRGDDLNILSKCANTYTNNGANAGGVVGYCMGPYHRDVISLVGCSFEGNGTSTVSVENFHAEGRALVGGIAGYANYKAVDCSVGNACVVNKSTSSGGCAAGKLFGWFASQSGLWTRGENFTPGTYEVTDCNSENVRFNVTDNVSTSEIY